VLRDPFLGQSSSAGDHRICGEIIDVRVVGGTSGLNLNSGKFGISEKEKIEKRI